MYATRGRKYNISQKSIKKSLSHARQRNNASHDSRKNNAKAFTIEEKITQVTQGREMAQLLLLLLLLSLSLLL